MFTCSCALRQQMGLSPFNNQTQNCLLVYKNDRLVSAPITTTQLKSLRNKTCKIDLVRDINEGYPNTVHFHMISRSLLEYCLRNSFPLGAL